MSTDTINALGGEHATPSTQSTTDSARPVKAGLSMRKLAIIGVSIALVAGGIGALISAAAFPAKDGKGGATGAVGQTGPAGPTGPAGSAAAVDKVNVDTNKLGYCFSTTNQSNNGAYWITGVQLFPPTDSNGALSCPNGQFVSLTPVSPQGGAVPNYNAMVPTTGTSSQAVSTGSSSTATPSTTTS